MIQPAATSLQRLLQSRLFEAATVQRDYQWERPECLTLLDDLERAFLESKFGRAFAAPSGAAVEAVEPPHADAIAAFTLAPDAEPDDIPPTDMRDFSAADTPVTISSDSYFLGTIVLGPKTSEGRTTVYDGLQRMTTLTILLAVLRDNGVHGDLHRLIMDGAKPRLRLLVRDGSLYQEVQQKLATQKSPTDQPTTDTAERIRDAVALYRASLSQWSPEKQKHFTKYILDHTAFVTITVDDAALAIQTFYTTNTRGKQLNSADLLKAQIVDLVASERGGAVGETIASQWTSLHRQLGDSMVPYLNSLDFYYRRTYQRQDAWVQDLFETLRQERKATQFVNWAVSGAAHWKLIDSAETAGPPLAGIRLHLRRLSLMKPNDWKAVALAILLSGHASKARLLARLEAGIVAMHIMEESTRDRARILGEAIRTLNGSGAGAWRVYPVSGQKIERIRRVLTRGQMDDSVAGRLLRWLEATRWGKDLPRHLSSASLEHIFPKTVPQSSAWMRGFPDRGQHPYYLRQIGNLAVVDEETNKKLGNLPYPDKQTIAKSAEGKYRLFDEAFATPDWTADTVVARTDALVKEVTRLLQVAN